MGRFLFGCEAGRVIGRLLLDCLRLSCSDVACVMGSLLLDCDDHCVMGSCLLGCDISW